MKRDNDGKYRWKYQLNMLTKPVVLISILKIFFYILLGMWIFFGLLKIKDCGFIEAFKEQGKELLIPAAVLFGLSITGYLILAAIYKWKYCVIFEMDEIGIRHIQDPEQFRKAQIVGAVTAVTGAAARKPGTVGTGLLSATKNEQYTNFSHVKRIRTWRIFNTIETHALFNHNQIYVPREEYDFVLNYIKTHINSNYS